MKIIEPSVINITPSHYDLESIYKHIELCGRTCYKSQDKITEDSYKKFCDNIKNNKHLSVFEHGTVYLSVFPGDFDYEDIVYRYKMNEYSVVYAKPNNQMYYITTNMRVLIEHGWEDDLKYLCEPTEYHEKRYTFKVVCDRAVSHEWVRHRHLSFSQESQRYCAYNKEKFGGEGTIVRPHWLKTHLAWAIDLNKYLGGAEHPNNVDSIYLNSCMNSFNTYFELLNQGIKPQDARAVLPNSCKTEMIVTGFESDWKHFLSLRSSKAGATGQHPDINILANQIYDYLNNENI